MTNRIHELYEQASNEIKLVDVKEPTWQKVHTLIIDRFADLIVREMLQKCEDHPAWTGRMIGENLKEYFGIK